MRLALKALDTSVQLTGPFSYCFAGSTLLPKPTVELADGLYDSPGSIRSRRSLVQSSPAFPEEAATIVSISSGLSTLATAAKPKKKDTSKTRAARVDSNFVNESSSECDVDAILESPNSDSRRARISENNESQRVSLSPLLHTSAAGSPHFEGTDHEKLYACLDALKSANYAAQPTFANDKTSKFASNIRAVSNFMLAVVNSNGQHGGEVGALTSLYVCGAPGLGKTSGVKWCCDNAVAILTPDAPKPTICSINAVYLASQRNPGQCLMNELGKCLGSKCADPRSTTIKNMLKSKNEKPNTGVVIVVVDEIDALVSHNGKSSNNEAVLQTLLEWANDPNMQMALIGISNSMNDEIAARILERGSVSDVS
jgi:hypothetical protein